MQLTPDCIRDVLLELEAFLVQHLSIISKKADTNFRIIRIWKNVPTLQQKSFLNYKFSFFKTRDVMTLFATLDITSKDMEPMVVKTGFNF